MKHRRRGGHNYKFTEKTHSIRGAFAIFLALISILACVVFLWYAFDCRGNASIYMGSAGFLGFFVSIAALCVSISSVREPETFRALPYTSLGFSLVSVAIWIALYTGGLLWNG